MHVKKTNYVPKISVLMSVYNGERWLSEAIQSILNQSFKDFEFIIISDGSSDKSNEIIQEHAANDNRICAHFRENVGLTKSLNFALRIANGEWIARIDADDISHPERLKKQLDCVEQSPDLVLLGTSFNLINQNGIIQNRYRCPTKHHKILRWLERSRPFFPHSSSFFNRRIALSVGGYRDNFIKAQDHDLWLRLSQIGNLGAIDKPLVSIRKHSNQTSLTNMGFDQFHYSQLAMTSYWLRIYGLEDPVEKGQQHVLEEFIEFIIEKTAESNYFKYIIDFFYFKKRVDNHDQKINKFFCIASSLFINPTLFIRHFYFKFFGSTLTQKLAKDWSKQRKTINEKR